MTDAKDQISARMLLEQYPTRETKTARIREIDKALGKMEESDEQNDPRLILGHIRLTRGFRMGCGVFLLCLTLMSYTVWRQGHGWVLYLAIAFGACGVVMLLRGALYRPDPQLIKQAYRPYRGTTEYKLLVEEMEILSRALAQDLQAEDEG